MNTKGGKMKHVIKCLLIFFLLFSFNTLAQESNEDEFKAVEETKRGIEYLKIGEYDKAIESFTKAATTDQSFSYAYLLRGCAFLKTGKYDIALKDANRAIQLGDVMIERYFYTAKYEAYLLRGAVLWSQKKYSEAKNDFIESSSGSIISHNIISRVNFRLDGGNY
jgi:tetratricopeptide (TPR) repeat protein